MIRLSDDGTMDTVLVCDECGQEMRYNYDPSGPSDPEENRPDDWEDCGQCNGAHPSDFIGDCRDDVNRWPSQKCIERLREQAYDAFIDWAIDDATDSHECQTRERGDDDGVEYADPRDYRDGKE